MPQFLTSVIFSPPEATITSPTSMATSAPPVTSPPVAPVVSLAPSITIAQVLDVATSIEGLIKNPQLPLIETYVVDAISLITLIVGAFAKNLSIPVIPQSVIIGVSLLVLLVINVVRAHESAGVKKAAIAQFPNVAAYRVELGKAESRQELL